MASPVQSIQARDGTLHPDLKSAVAHEAREEIDSWFIDPLNASRLIANSMTHDREKWLRLKAIMEQEHGQ